MNGPVQLYIERIVIDGVPLSRAEAGQLRGAVEAELARLLAAGPHVAWSEAALHSVTAPAIAVGAPVRPLELGRAIAHSVHASLLRGS
jgi:hypothetical protein